MQDNVSVMKLERIWRASSSQCMKYINVQYFFIKDQIDLGDINIKYCPVEMIWAYVLINLLQSAAFRRYG